MSARFGVNLWQMQSTRLAPRHHSQLYGEMLDDARLVDELGYDSLWVTEHHFWYDGYCPSVFVATGAVAAVTARLRIASGCVLLPMHDPLRVAQSAATVHQLSGGRMIVGAAVGYRDAEFDGFEVSRRTRGRRFDEGLEVLLRALSGELFSFEGRFYHYHDVQVATAPEQRPIPLFLAATTEVAVRRAARLGAHVIFGSTAGPERIRALIAEYHRTAQQAGVAVDGVLFSSTTPVWVAPTDEQARGTVVPALRYLLREQLGGWRYLTDESGRLIGFDQPEALDRAVAQALDVAIIGSPERVIEGLERQRDAGINYFGLRMKYDNVDQSTFHRTLRLFADEVMPYFEPPTTSLERT